MGHFTYKQIKYESTVHNQVADMLESELYFESTVTLDYDEEEKVWVTVDHETNLIGFATYRDGKTVTKCIGIKVPWYNVILVNQDDFETMIYSSAVDKHFYNSHGNSAN